MKKEFMVERQGKSFVLYAGLLDEAHNKGLKSIRTKLLQIPTPENGNVAVCFAEVEMERGVFTGLGDAAPENVSRLMLPHLIRMAETRSKARALRDAVNVGVVALEELGELDESMPADEESHRWTSEPAAGGRPRNGQSFHHVSELPLEQVATSSAQRPGGEGHGAGNGGANPATATPAQVRAIYLIARDQHGLSEAQVEERSLASYGCLPAELTKKQASELITTLKR